MGIVLGHILAATYFSYRDKNWFTTAATTGVHSEAPLSPDLGSEWDPAFPKKRNQDVDSATREKLLHVSLKSPFFSFSFFFFLFLNFIEWMIKPTCVCIIFEKHRRNNTNTHTYSHTHTRKIFCTKTYTLERITTHTAQSHTHEIKDFLSLTHTHVTKLSHMKHLTDTHVIKHTHIYTYTYELNEHVSGQLKYARTIFCLLFILLLFCKFFYFIYIELIIIPDIKYQKCEWENSKTLRKKKKKDKTSCHNSYYKHILNIFFIYIDFLWLNLLL